LRSGGRGGQMTGRNMQRLLQSSLVGVTALLLVSCQRAPDEPRSPAVQDSPTNLQVFAVKGLVRSLDPENALVHIEHEAIPGYMGQMTMPFDVKDTNELSGLLVGDAVSFRLQVTDREGWIDQIAKIPLTRVTLKPKPRPPVRVTRVVEPLEAGDLVPDYPFTNELGRTISLHQFRGQALGLTFIFTRCPYPTFCPRMSANFAQACQQLLARTDAPTNWHLLSVSFDPDYDTPAVLKAYAEGYAYDPSRWSFATGAMIEIDAITEQFEMVFAPDGSFFSHNVRTAVIDAHGRVQRIFAGNEWKVADFVAEMVKAASMKESPATPTAVPGPGAAPG
jgi:protein SCO1/2